MGLGVVSTTPIWAGVANMAGLGVARALIGVVETTSMSCGVTCHPQTDHIGVANHPQMTKGCYGHPTLFKIIIIINLIKYNFLMFLIFF
jgi:hypothetical protein